MKTKPIVWLSLILGAFSIMARADKTTSQVLDAQNAEIDAYTRRIVEEPFSVLDAWVTRGGPESEVQSTVVPACRHLDLLYLLVPDKPGEHDSRMDLCTKMTINRVHPQPEFQKKEFVEQICNYHPLFRELCMRSGLREHVKPVPPTHRFEATQKGVDHPQTAQALWTEPSCLPSSVAKLVGLWEGHDTSRGGIGHAIEFYTDSKFVETTTAIVNGSYRIAENRLFLVSGEPSQANEAQAGFEFHIEGDVLSQKGPHETTIRKERISEVERKDNPLVGVWRYHDYSGRIAFEKYTPDGKYFFRSPFATSSGVYSVDGCTLSLSKEEVQNFRFMLHENELLLRKPHRSSSVSRYAREPAGRWYDSEHLVKQRQH